MATRKQRKKPVLVHWLGLIRWKNTIIALICVMVAFTLGDSPVPRAAKWIVYLVVATIFAGGNVLNDYIDYRSDAIAHPDRPIPSGGIKRKHALIVGIIFLSIGVLVSICGIGLYGPLPAIIAIFAALLLVFYDFVGGRIPFLGNFAVGLLGGMVFIFAGSVQGLTKGQIYGAGYAALFHLGREIVKDIADRQADEATGIRTLPSLIGDKNAARLASLALFLIIPLTIIPYFAGVLSVWYLGAVLLFVDLPILLLAWLMPLNITPRKAARYASDLKWVMVGGLVALFLGGISS